MHYSPDPKALVYRELNFVSTLVKTAQPKVSYDLDALYDEVSPEIYALFVGEAVEQLSLEVVRQAQMV